MILSSIDLRATQRARSTKANVRTAAGGELLGIQKSELLTETPPHRSFAVKSNESIMSTHRTDKNIALAPELLKRVESLAGTDRTADEVANEAVQKYVDAQENILNFKSFITRNRKDMEARGVRESDIAAEIAADRKDRRQ